MASPPLTLHIGKLAIMVSKADLKPNAKPRIMDLVKEAGVNISEWESSARGASNPNYCYEWAFIECGKVVVLTLWFSSIKEDDGLIFYHSDPPTRSSKFVPPSTRSVRARRWRKLLDGVQEAYSKKLPIRVVISDGVKVRPPGTSLVQRRLLDPVPWVVTAFNPQSGRYSLARGKRPRVTDQFEAHGISNQTQEVKRREMTQLLIIRDPNVRQRVLASSDGKCQWCKRRGFEMTNGDLYLETHHIIPLSEKGEDREENIVVLCPNHHREAHHGKNQAKIREKLQGLRARYSGGRYGLTKNRPPR